MSVDAVTWSPALPPVDLPGETPLPGAALSAPVVVPPGTLTADAALPVPGLEDGLLAGATLAEANAANAASPPWDSLANQLSAGGPLRGLAELARSGPALPSDSATGDAQAAVSGAGLAEPPLAPTLLPGVPLALQSGASGQPRRASDSAQREEDWLALRERQQGGRGDASQDDADEEPARPQAQLDARAPAARVDALAPDATWCAPLLAALQRSAASEVAAHSALQAAAEVWVRGRAVLLACPRAATDAQAAWLFVLRPQPGARPLQLGGERFAASLRWARAGAGAGRWWQVRVVKNYSLRRGGQLLTQGEDADGRVSCELQLGPFPPALPRWREALVRIDQVQRLWQALGTQWSLPLLVCDQALLAPAVAPAVAPCRSEA